MTKKMNGLTLKEYLQKYTDCDIPISGGIGDTFEDAIVFGQTFEAVAIEYFIVKAIFGESKVVGQKLLERDGRLYDVLKVVITDKSEKPYIIVFDVTESMEYESMNS